MKQVDIARVLNVVVSRLLKKHREADSIEECKQSAFILECKGLLLKSHCMLCIFFRPHAVVKGSKQNFEFSKVSGRTSRIRC